MILRYLFILGLMNSWVQGLPSICHTDLDCRESDPNSYCDRELLKKVFAALKHDTSLRGECKCMEWFFEYGGNCTAFARDLGNPCLEPVHCNQSIVNSECKIKKEEDLGKCCCMTGYDQVGTNRCVRNSPTRTTIRQTSPSTIVTTEEYETTWESPSTTKISTTPEEPSTSTTPSTTTPEESTPFTTSSELPTTHETTTPPVLTTTEPEPSTTDTITQTPEPETTPPPGPNCTRTDMWGRYWTLFRGTVNATRCCPERNPNNNETDCAPGDGIGIWSCTKTGLFYPDQPIYNCTTEWIDNIYKNITGDTGPIEPDQAGGFLNRIITNLLSAKDEAAQGIIGNAIFFGHELEKLVEIVESIMFKLNFDVMTQENQVQLENITKKSFEVSRELLKFEHPWAQLPGPTEQRRICTELYYWGIEQTGFQFTSRVNYPPNSDAPFYFPDFDEDGIEILSGLEAHTIKNESFIFPLNANTNSDSYIKLPESWKFKVIETPKDGSTSFVGMSLRSSIVTPRLHGFQINDTELVMNGNFMSFTLEAPSKPQDGLCIDLGEDRVEIRFNHDYEAWGSIKQELQREPHPDEPPQFVLGSATCVYWNPKELEWSTWGCELIKSEADYTICSCSHLTGFAVLMDYHGYTKPQTLLVVLTFLLGILSILSLLALILIFNIYSRDLNTMHNRITKYLSVSLMVSHLFIILFIDKRHFHLGNNTCFTFGALTHLTLLSSFSWMAICGAHLLKSVVIVFESKRNFWPLYMVLGYVPALIIVGVTVGVGLSQGPPITVYGGAFCWLTQKYIWAFLGPISAVILGNLFVLGVALKKTIGRQKNAAPQKTKIYRKRILGMISLSFLFGLTWVIGFFQLIRDESSHIAFAYLFTILNGSQGIFIFSFNIVQNEKIRAIILKKFEKLRVSRSKGSEKSKGSSTSRFFRRRGTTTAITDISLSKSKGSFSY